MAAALIGLHAECKVPMSGTPYNNTPQDIATLMTFIEPGHPSSREQWWKAATEQGAAKMVVKEIKSWSDNYLIRRGKDVIAVPLPRKTVGHVSLSLSGAEMSV